MPEAILEEKTITGSEEWERIREEALKDPRFRKRLTGGNLFGFFHIYFEEYLGYPTAPFHQELCRYLEDWNYKLVEMMGFRESAKSVFGMFGLPVWAMVTERAKMILLLGDSLEQIKFHIENIKSELENNELLVEDWGPFDVKVEGEESGKASEEWTKKSIVVPKYDCRIFARTNGQNIRGVRHRMWRPDLIIGDDVENSENVRSKEQRDKTYRWWTSDVIPAGSKNKTKYVLIGNLLHSDSLMSRMKKSILTKTRDGVLLEYPIMYEKGNALWPGKFPNAEELNKEKRKIDDVRTWQREYMLKVVPEEGAVIKDSWIKYWDRLPITEHQDESKIEAELLMSATGVDLAISKKEDADYTAMVSAKAYMFKDETVKIYILPNIVNERLGFHETIDTAGNVSMSVGEGNPSQLFVEDVAYQKAAIEEMERRLLPVEGIKPGGKDKRARLFSVSNMVQNGQVLFPRVGAEDLVIQLTGFGIEAHDDLADAFVIVMLGISRWGLQKMEVTWL